jgi:hypothetical protein
LEQMESVVAANGDTLMDDLDILGESSPIFASREMMSNPPSTTAPTSRFCSATP